MNARVTRMNVETKEPITLRLIAKSLGVSHVTVSLALRNAPQISLARRRQIQDAAMRMGYRPNAMATALGQRRLLGKPHPVTSGMAWINYWERPKEIHQYREFELYWESALATAAWYGYSLEEFVCNREFTLTRLDQVLQARGVRGILIPPHPVLPADWDTFPWHKYSVVRFGHSILRPRVHVVTSDQATNSMMAFAKIRALGYSRIGYVTTKAAQTRFKAGFLMAQSDVEAKIKVPPLVLSKEHQNDDGQKMLLQWLRKYRPDGLMTDVAVMPEMLKKAGYRIPHDIGVAALSVLDGNADTGINQNPEEIGKAAAEMLISLINHNHTGVPKICRELLIEGEWAQGTMMPPRIK
jgi:LacI family transcriptional regulator